MAFRGEGVAEAIILGFNSAVADRLMGRDEAAVEVATHWLVKSSKISFGNSRPSAAKCVSTRDL